jgi:hypothetical protein
MDCTVQFTIKGLERKKKGKKKQSHTPWVFFFLHKKYQKKLRSKSVRSFAKIYPKTLGLAGTLDSRIIFIILIILLNLHDLSLNEPGCNTGPKSIGCGSGYKVVS